MLFGHVVSSVARNLLSTALVFAVALAIGYRSPAGPLRWLAAVGILVLFMIALSFVAAAIGVLARSAEAANGMTFGLSFLPYPSSAFVPVSSMPSWLQGFARNQPVSQVIDAVRRLLAGQPVGSSASLAVAWSLGIAAVAVVAGGVVYRRRTEH